MMTRQAHARRDALIQRNRIDADALRAACEQASNHVRDTNARILAAEQLPPLDHARAHLDTIGPANRAYDDHIRALQALVNDSRTIAVSDVWVMLRGPRSIVTLWDRTTDSSTEKAT